MQEPPTWSASDSSPDAATLVEDKPRSFKQNLKRLSIMVVIIVVGAHLLAGFLATIWVVASYLIKPEAQFTSVKKIDMKPENRLHRETMQELAKLKPKPVLSNRIQSLKPGAIVLPNLPKAPVNAALPIDMSVTDASQFDGFGQTGTSTTGAEAGGGFFGTSGGKSGSGLLEGNLYDLKQTRGGSRNAMDKPEYLKIMGQVVEKGDTVLKRFYTAPSRLYATQIIIPTMNASAAPAEFKVQDKVEPKYWLTVYKGRVIAPATGKFVFKGAADDVLLVWFDNKLVHDGSIVPTSSPLNKQPGVEFSVVRGRPYDITVMVGECPGGNFNAGLYIQRVGDNSGPYPFRMAGGRTIPQGDKKVDPGTPIWRPAPMQETASGRTGVGM